MNEGAVAAGIVSSAGDLGIPDSIREKLFTLREKRIHPLKDDKILTDWNGLMIAALARAGGALDNPEYIAAARGAADFVLSELRNEDGSLLHRYREGESGVAGFATDYAYFIWGLIELYEASFEEVYLREALELMEILLDKFWDDKAGGFFLTSEDASTEEATKLLVRPRDDTDTALPSANSVALLDLIKLGRMTQNISYEERAIELIRKISDFANGLPAAFTFALGALSFHLGPSYEVVIAGREGAADSLQIMKALRKEFIPNKVSLFRPEGEEPEIAQLSPFVQFQVSMDGRATVYVCQDYTCELPVTSADEMLSLLGR